MSLFFTMKSYYYVAGILSKSFRSFGFVGGVFIISIFSSLPATAAGEAKNPTFSTS